MFIQFSGKCGQKHEIMDKNFESTYEHLSEPRNVHTIFWKMWTKTWNYGQKYEIMDKNFESTYEYLSESRNVHTIFWKMWTKTWNYRQKHEIMDKHFESIYEHSSEPRKCRQYCPNLKNNCPHFLGSLECSWMFISRLEMFVHNFMFLSIILCFCPHFLENCMNISGFT